MIWANKFCQILENRENICEIQIKKKLLWNSFLEKQATNNMTDVLYN